MTGRPGSASSRYGYCIWLTGIHASGKTTLAQSLSAMLQKSGRHVVVMDEDEMEEVLLTTMNPTKYDINLDVARTGWIANQIVLSGGIAICSFLSPYVEARNKVRDTMPQDRFVEVWVDTHLSVCFDRDKRGIYSRARKKIITGVAGFDAPYEAPDHDDALVVDGKEPVSTSIETIIQYVYHKGIA